MASKLSKNSRLKVSTRAVSTSAGTRRTCSVLKGLFLLQPFKAAHHLLECLIQIQQLLEQGEFHGCSPPLRGVVRSWRHRAVVSAAGSHSRCSSSVKNPHLGWFSLDAPAIFQSAAVMTQRPTLRPGCPARISWYRATKRAESCSSGVGGLCRNRNSAARHDPRRAASSSSKHEESSCESSPFEAFKAPRTASSTPRFTRRIAS